MFQSLQQSRAGKDEIGYLQSQLVNNQAEIARLLNVNLQREASNPHEKKISLISMILDLEVLTDIH